MKVHIPPIQLSPCQIKRKEFNSKVKAKYKKTHEPVCSRCGMYSPWGTGRMHIHHKTALSDEGDNDETNLITLCDTCHFEYHLLKSHHCITSTEMSKWLKTPPGIVITLMYMSGGKNDAKFAITHWGEMKEEIYRRSSRRYISNIPQG